MAIVPSSSRHTLHSRRYIHDYSNLLIVQIHHHCCAHISLIIYIVKASSITFQVSYTGKLGMRALECQVGASARRRRLNDRR